MSDTAATLITEIHEAVENVNDPWILCSLLGRAAAELERQAKELDRAKVDVQIARNLTQSAASRETAVIQEREKAYERARSAEADRDTLTKALRDVENYAAEQRAENGRVVHILEGIVNLVEEDTSDEDAAFIAAASPDVVLALVNVAVAAEDAPHHSPALADALAALALLTGDAT